MGTKQVKPDQVRVEEARPHPSLGREEHTCLVPLATQRSQKPNVLRLTLHQNEREPHADMYPPAQGPLPHARACVGNFLTQL